MRLRDAQIRMLELPAKAYKLFDGGGLFLHVTPSGRYWRYRYRYAGKDKVLSIGVYPRIGLKDARMAHMAAKADLAAGIDPGVRKKRSKRQTERISGMTFEAIAREWHSMMLPNWSNPKHGQQVINTLQTYVFPSIGGLTPDEITPPDVLEVLKTLQDKKETAVRVKQRINAVFDYAIQIGRTKINPAQAMPKIGQGKVVEHHLSLPEALLDDFFQKVEEYPYQSVKHGLKLLLLTFVRPGELRRAEWSEIQGNEWHIPPEKMKMRLPHIVPLSGWALDILDALREINQSNSPYVIPAKNGQMLNDSAFSIAMKKMGYQGIAVPHGFRSMASSILNQSGLWNVDAIERQLAHKEPNKIRAAYNRAEYLNERHEMMNWYSDYIKSKIIG